MRHAILGCVLAVGLTAPASAEDLEFLLGNESGSAVVGFFVTPSGANSWGYDLLEGDILDHGYEVDVIIADGLTVCSYDIRTEFESGDVFEDYDLDLCELGEYVFE